MDLSTYIQELRESLQAAAAFGDEQAQRSASALAGTLEPAARLALIHALSDMAAAVTSQLNESANPGDEISVDVRLVGRDVQVSTHRSRSTTASAGTVGGESFTSGSFSSASTSSDTAGRTLSDASGDLTRTTVRMFNQLKSEAEKAASEQGVSLNSFISRAVADSIRTDIPRKWKGRSDARHEAHPDSPTTISGYVQG